MKEFRSGDPFGIVVEKSKSWDSRTLLVRISSTVKVSAGLDLVSVASDVGMVMSTEVGLIIVV